MAGGLTDVLLAHPLALGIAIVADFIAGDPVYAAHPVRLIGRALSAIEGGLRRVGADGRGGGIALFAILGAVSTAAAATLVLAASLVSVWLGWAIHTLLVYSLLALGDLVRHVWRVERALAQRGLDEGRRAISALVGRDTSRMDEAACRRAAIESLSENLTDGFTSAVFWYAVAGLPGLVLFKVVSTMDSMVGYRTPRYIHFGWCGARLDDAMNLLPARATWLLVAAAAAVLPGCSGAKALRVGWRQHQVLPGPNSGWSEAAAAGGIRRRLVGPIWIEGRLVTDIWIGDPLDPPAGSRDDLARAIALVGASAGLAAGLAISILAALR